MQSDSQKAEIIERILYRAAEAVGDITEPAMSLYYQRLPAVKPVFEQLARGDLAQLEGQMVENSLFCLMRWFDSPSEVRILLSDSLLHHHDTLGIATNWYSEFIDVCAGMIEATIPPENKEELAVWREVCTALYGVINSAYNLAAGDAKKVLR